MRLRRPRRDVERGVDLDLDRDADGFSWPGEYQAAVSISFDDARRSQIDRGLPMLDDLGITATFFVLPDGVKLARRGWSDVVAAGHEIGSHTARHPCSANFTWSRHHTIEDLTLDDMAREIAEADTWIAQTLGVEPRAFAYPCGHTFVGRGRDTRSYVPLVAERFLAGRTFNDVATNSPRHCDLAQVQAMNSDGLEFDQLRPILETVHQEGAWLVLGGHEIGPRGEAETTTPATVTAIVEWCRAHGVWIDTVSEVATRVRALQQAEAGSRSA